MLVFHCYCKQSTAVSGEITKEDCSKLTFNLEHINTMFYASFCVISKHDLRSSLR